MKLAALLPALFALLVLAPQDDAAKQLKSKDPLERIAAIDALRAEGGDKAAKAIAKLLDDSDWEVCERAAQALGAMGQAGVADDLVEAALEGPVARVRRAAAIALAAVDPDEGSKALAKRARSKTLLTACEALAIVAPHATAPSAPAALEKQFKEKDRRLHAAVARTLVGVSRGDRAQVLEELLGSSSLVVRAAALDEARDDPRGRGFVDVTGEADHEVVGDDLALPQLECAGTIDALDRRLRPERAATVRVTGATHPVEPTRRERAVVVADLVEHLRGLAEEARVLLLGELRLREDIGREIDHRVEVAREREARHADPVARDADVERRAETVEDFIELGAIATARSSTCEQRGVAMQPLGTLRIRTRAAADRDFEPHQRCVVGRLVDDFHAASSSLSSSSSSPSASSSASGSAITIVRRSGRRYVRTTRATSSAVICASRSASVLTLRKSPSAIS